MLCDVVNRVEGRVEVIKGVERKPKNKTQALTNINKALEYLRGLSKINSKHLWAAKEIVEGDENVIWGLLDDMKALFAPVPVKPKPIPVMSKPPPSIAIPVSASYGKISIPKAVVKDDKSKRSYSASMKKFSSKLSSVSTSRVSRPPSSRSIQSESARPERFSISPEMKKNMFNWVEALGIEYEPNTNPYLDILKNGVLLCDLMRVLENVNIKTNLKPRTIQAVHENFNNAIGVCISKRVEIPHLLLRTSEHLSQNSEVLHGVLYYLMAAYPYAGPAEYQPCVLQYGAVNIRNLEKTIVNWIDELQILQPSPCAFAELISELKKGTLLCVVTSKVTGIRISNVIPDPKTEQTALNNIRKSLEVLRKLPKMSQKFTYNEKEIYKGNFNILLGLLEDILRWTDGVPARKSGDPYKDGPYLRESLKKPAKISEETFNTTFGSMHSPKLGERSEILIEGPDQYIQWLYSIGAQFPRSINFSDEHIPEFTTGVLICNITEALEKIRIPGIDKEPRTRASALQNINKALFILKKKKGFPKELQQCADEIFLGNGELIRNLISELMRIYKA